MAFLSFIFSGGIGTKLSMFLLVAALAAAATFAGMKALEIHELNSKITTLTKANTQLTVDNEVLIKNNKVLKDNQQILTDANQINYETVKKLVDERAANTAAVASLAAARQRDRIALEKANKTIDDLIKDPKNDGVVSPVLKAIIKDIQSKGAK